MADYTSTFTETDGVDDVEAADFSTEFDAIQTAIATKYDSDDLLDEDDMASNSDTKFPSQQSVKAYVDTKIASLNTKILEIGDWNMDSTLLVQVAHGVTLSKIRTISVLIREDSNTNYHDFAARDEGASYAFADATYITLSRKNAGVFDSTSYDSTSYNRGWITIQYTD